MIVLAAMAMGIQAGALRRVGEIAVATTYGTGAIFGSPAGDQRDIEFAERYQLPFKPVVLPPAHETQPAAAFVQLAGPRTEVALHAAVIEPVPVPGRHRGCELLLLHGNTSCGPASERRRCIN